MEPQLVGIFLGLAIVATVVLIRISSHLGDIADRLRNR